MFFDVLVFHNCWLVFMIFWYFYGFSWFLDGFHGFSRYIHVFAFFRFTILNHAQLLLNHQDRWPLYPLYLMVAKHWSRNVMFALYCSSLSLSLPIKWANSYSRVSIPFPPVQFWLATKMQANVEIWFEVVPLQLVCPFPLTKHIKSFYSSFIDKKCVSGCHSLDLYYRPPPSCESNHPTG